MTLLISNIIQTTGFSFPYFLFAFLFMSFAPSRYYLCIYRTENARVKIMFNIFYRSGTHYFIVDCTLHNYISALFHVVNGDDDGKFLWTGGNNNNNKGNKKRKEKINHRSNAMNSRPSRTFIVLKWFGLERHFKRNKESVSVQYRKIE